jgi:putative sigma-54 modulation protein
MDMTIRSRNVEVSESLRAAARDKVTRLARHLDGWDEAEINFFEERNPRIADKEVCEVTLRGHGHIIRAKAASPDPFTSIDRVIDKLEHQVEKLRTRTIRKAHHGDQSKWRQSVHSGGPVADEDGDEREAGRGTGRIVKVKQFNLKPMTPEEAVLQMELLGHTFYFFTNAESGVPAVVYRRDDGDVGLIDAS